MMHQQFSPRFLVARAHDILAYYGFEVAELQSSLYIILRGLWIVNPLVDNTRMYMFLSPISPPIIWSAVFVVVGLYQLWALLVDDISHRRRATFAACCLWLFVGLVSVKSFFSTTSVPLFIIFAIQNAWSFLRMQRRT